MTPRPVPGASASRTGGAASGVRDVASHGGAPWLVSGVPRPVSGARRPVSGVCESWRGRAMTCVGDAASGVRGVAGRGGGAVTRDEDAATDVQDATSRARGAVTRVLDVANRAGGAVSRGGGTPTRARSGKPVRTGVTRARNEYGISARHMGRRSLVPWAHRSTEEPVPGTGGRLCGTARPRRRLLRQAMLINDRPKVSRTDHCVGSGRSGPVFSVQAGGRGIARAGRARGPTRLPLTERAVRHVPTDGIRLGAHGLPAVSGTWRVRTHPHGSATPTVTFLGRTPS